MSKGQRNSARQPVARVKGRETSQSRYPGASGNNSGQTSRGKAQPGSFIKSRHPQEQRATGTSGESAKRQPGRKPAAVDRYGNPIPRQGQALYEKAPMFKMSRQELAQQQQNEASRQGNGNTLEEGAKRGRSQANRSSAYGDKPAARRTPRTGEAFEHERRFGNKNAARPHQEPAAGETPAAATGRPQGNKPLPPVQKAKKLRLRSPNQDVRERSQRLRDVRVDADTIEPVRLQKALANSGVGSRREIEEWIEAGLVQVNGKKASLGDKVGPRDKVVAKGDAIKLKWADRLPRIIMYHKQEGEIVSRDDPEGRVSVFARLPQTRSSRWVAVGRLDVNTSGLLLITTSGELANCMMHPSFEVEREYSVRVLGDLTPEIMKEMMAGVELEDGTASFSRIFARGGAEEGANQWYNVVLKEGRNREVRRMFEHFGLTVSRLIRVRFGNIGLPPRLKRGQYYELNEAEVAAVMKWSNLTVTGRRKTR